MTSVKENINIAKIRPNFMSFIVKLDIGQFPKHNWMKECVTFATLRVEIEKHIFLDCPTYIHIKYKFQIFFKGQPS